jgi:type II secretory pathway predicted ATPase ExeA
MYEAFFHMKHKPFSLLPDPDFLYLSSKHAIALSLLEYSLTGQAGFCVITGEIGSGKTTLVRAFLGRVGREFTVGLISNTHAGLGNMATWALAAFGQRGQSENPALAYQELADFLIAEYSAGRQCLLIVDEAQNLSLDALEELRLLSNINSGKDLLLQIVLSGQPQLGDKLKRPELVQFAQRISVSYHLAPLSFADTRHYIEHRLQVAGATQPIFSEMAMGAVQYFSGGVPRLINSICDMAMVYAFADGRHSIDEDLIFRVVSDRQASGVSAFPQTVPADDAALRADIQKMADSLTPAPKPAAAAESAAESAAGPAAAPATAAPAELAVPTPAQSPASISARAPAAAPATNGAIRTARASDYFFQGGEEEDLVLTAAQQIAIEPSPLSTPVGASVGASVGPAGGPAVRELRPNGAAAPAAGAAANGTSPAKPAAAGAASPQNTNLPRETGTAAPRRRSWWRRVSSRGG